MDYYLLSSIACTSTDGTQVLLLPLVSHLVRFAIVVAHRVVCVDVKQVSQVACEPGVTA